MLNYFINSLVLLAFDPFNRVSLSGVHQAELHQLEEQLLKEHKERESNIARLRQKVDQRKVQSEKPDKKVRCKYSLPWENGPIKSQTLI